MTVLALCCQEHLTDEGVPRELQMRVVDYYDYIWKLYGGYSIDALFSHVTLPMKAKIFSEFSGPLLTAVSGAGVRRDRRSTDGSWCITISLKAAQSVRLLIAKSVLLLPDV